MNAVIAQAQQEGKIDEIIVLSWADKSFPSKKLNKLSNPQNELAENRNKAVEQYMKSLKDVSVDTYNMAKQPNAFSKWFNTDDNKLKNTLVAAGLPTSADSDQTTNKASHSVILIKVK